MRAWIFIEKNRYGQIIDIALFGSITSMANAVTVEVGGRVRNAHGIRYLVGKKKRYIDANYHIEQLVIQTEKHKN